MEAKHNPPSVVPQLARNSARFSVGGLLLVLMARRVADDHPTAEPEIAHPVAERKFANLRDIARVFYDSSPESSDWHRTFDQRFPLSATSHLINRDNLYE